jgi:hypothetical protein
MLRIVCSPELIDAVLARARFDLKHTGCVDTAKYPLEYSVDPIRPFPRTKITLS